MRMPIHCNIIALLRAGVPRILPPRKLALYPRPTGNFSLVSNCGIQSPIGYTENTVAITCNIYLWLLSSNSHSPSRYCRWTVLAQLHTPKTHRTPPSCWYDPWILPFVYWNRYLWSRLAPPTNLANWSKRSKRLIERSLRQITPKRRRWQSHCRPNVGRGWCDSRMRSLTLYDSNMIFLTDLIDQ